MPKERFMGIHQDPVRWDGGDWFNCASAANCTAAQQMVASAGAGNRHYISYLSISSPSAQVLTIQDGAGTVMKRFYSTASANCEWILPRGMEYRCPATGQKIMISSNVSASTYWTIGGFYQPYTA
jgi:hypothetical protein